MDNLRIFLWVGLLMLVWLTVQTWQQTFAPKPADTDDDQRQRPPLPALRSLLRQRRRPRCRHWPTALPRRDARHCAGRRLNPSPRPRP